MNTPELELLNPEQIHFLEAHQEVLAALLEIMEQADFKAVFGDMPPGEMVSRWVNTLNFDAKDARALVANRTLNVDQMTFLVNQHKHEIINVINALFEFAETSEFKQRFGELSVSEVLSRFENTLLQYDEPDPVLSDRYQRLKSELEHNDPAILLHKLRDSSLFDDLNQDEN